MKLLLFAVFLTSQVHAQVSGYSFVQSSTTYTPIVAPTSVHASGWDDAVATAANGPIGFNFVFNGVTYTSCRIATNGHISFGTTATTGSNYTPIASAAGYAGAISAFGRDLISNSSTITRATEGTAPNRVFIVQWNNARRYDLGAVTGDVLNFQIRLYETSNQVQIVYGTCSASNTTARTCQVGLRGSANTDYNARSSATDWSTTTLGGSNAATVTSSNTIMPASGLTFTWTPATCFAPTALTNTVLSLTSADHSWSAPSSGTVPSGYEWAVTTSATPPASGTATAGLTASSPSLTANTTYYLHVRSDCGGGTFSAWATSMFATLEGNTCGLVQDLALLTSPYSGTTVGFTNNFTNSCLDGTGGDRIFKIDVPAGASLYIGQSTNAYDSKARVAYGGSCPGSTEINTGYVGNLPTQTTTGTALGCFDDDDLTHYYFNNTTGSTQTVYWTQDSYQAGSGTFTLEWLLVPAPTCFPPSALINTLTSSTSATHSWSAASPAPGVGYEWAVTTSATPPASGTATTGLTASSPSLTANTTYYLHVRSDCGLGDFSTWVTSPSFFTGYCLPTYSFGTPDGDLISNVTIVGTTLDNNSGTVAGLPSYTYYTGASNLTCDLSAGTSYTVSVSNGNFGSQNMAAWIDFNDNLVFEGSEKIGFTTSAMAANTTATFTISLPCNPSIGVHRMRIRDVYSTAGNTIDPCANYGWGETEDYDVNVLAPPPCPAILNLASSAITATTATATWSVGCVETLWDVDVSTSATPSGTPSNPGVTSTTFNASSLTPNTLYFVHVRANCGGGNGESVWSTISFTTLPLPPACVTNPIATPDASCDNQNLVFSWDASPTATSYAVNVGITPGGTEIANNFNVGANLSLTFLDPSLNTTYYWTVIPSNIAGPATGCVEQSYLTGTDGCVCLPIYTFGKTDGDLISNVVIPTTTLANNTGTASTNPAYTYFNGGGSQTASLQAGTSYTVQVTNGSYAFGGQQVAAWIDYNDDEVFDISERIGFTTTNFTGAFQTASFNISLACNPPVGVHRMRVRMVWNTSGNTIDPCASYGYGETEDYDITILAPPACPQISGLAASNITSSGADITWVTGCTETAWDVHVSTSATPPGSPANVGVTSTTFAASGLASNTLHYAHVRANCGGGNGVSTWVSIPFTTALAPPTNDECAGAISFGTISANPSCQVVELGAATLSDAQCNGFGVNDVYYSFTVPASAGASVQVFYSTTNNTGSTDRIFEVLTACGGLSIACSDLESGSFTVSPGTYILRTHTYFVGTSNFNLCLYLTPPVPTNDNICSAQTIKSTGGTSMNTYSTFGSMTCDNRTTNTSLATATGGQEITCAFGGAGAKSVWYKFTTPACVVGGVVPFDIEITTDNALTTFDTRIDLFASSDGTCTGTLSSVICNDDLASAITTCGGNTPNVSTIIRTDLTPSTTYYLLIDGYFGGSGIVEVSGRALTDAHTAVSNTPTSVTLTTDDKGAALYSYYYKQVGSPGYSLMNSASLTDTRILTNGVSYQTQVLYRCTSAGSQFYRTPVVTVAVPSIAACTPVSALDCAPDGLGGYTISWPEVSGLYTNGGLLSGYQIFYRVIGSAGYTFLSNPTVTCTGGVCSYTFAGLTNPAGYEFWIKTRCSSTVLLQSNIATCAGSKSAIGATHTFVNPTTGAEFYDIALTEDWNNFGLEFSDLGEYYVGINKDNEIYAVKTAEPNMIHAGTDVTFELVPNPTNASTTMTFNNTIKSGTFQVVDAMGREVLSGDISNTNAVELDGSKWNAGVYLVQVTTNDKTTMRRLVVSK